MATDPIQGPRGPLATKSAKVTHVSDGDTFDAVIEGSTKAERVRVCGINTWELDDYGSTPKGDGAAAAIETRKIIAKHPNVKLSSRDPNAVTGDRLKRYAEVQLEDGTWIDLGFHLCKLGLARFLAQKDEYDRNLQYAQAMRVAMKSRLGMWSTLGTGPAGALELRVDWDGDETVSFKNKCKKDVDLTGFWFCDGMTRSASGANHSGRGYEFAAGTVIPAGKTLKVIIGEGKDSDLVKYWRGIGTHVFDNPIGDPIWVSDGVYLGDKNGHIVNTAVYPNLTKAPTE